MRRVTGRDRRALARTSEVYSFVFSGITPGIVSSLPGGWVQPCASAPGSIQTGTSALVIATTADQIRVGRRLTAHLPGVAVERAVENVGIAVDSLTVTGGTATSGQSDPAGGTGARQLVDAGGGVLAALVHNFTAPKISSVWHRWVSGDFAWPLTGATTGVHPDASAQKDGVWRRYQQAFPSDTQVQMRPAIELTWDGGGTLAAAGTGHFYGYQLQTGDVPNEYVAPSTTVPARPLRNLASRMVSAGRCAMRVRFRPFASRSAYTGTSRLVSFDANNEIRLEHSTGNITAVLNGVTASCGTMNWTQSSTFSTIIECVIAWGQTTSVQIRYRSSIDEGATWGPWAGADATITAASLSTAGNVHVMSDASGNNLDSYVLEVERASEMPDLPFAYSIPGLVHAWDLSEPGVVVVDGKVASVPSITATASLANTTAAQRPTWSATGGPKGGPRATFASGSSTNLIATFAAALASGDPRTVVVVARVTGVAQASVVDGSATNRHRFYHNGGTSLTQHVAGSEIAISCVRNAWHVIAGVKNGASSFVRIGANKVTGSAGNADLPGITAGKIGGAASDYLDGDIAFIGVWNRALTDAEIDSLVAHYVGWTPLDLGDALLGWYDASDTTTLTLGGGGTWVASIADKSANGRTLTQQGAGGATTLGTLNGRQCLVSVATNLSLTNGTGTPKHYFFAAEYDGPMPPADFYGLGGTDAGNLFLFMTPGVYTWFGTIPNTTNKRDGVQGQPYDAAAHIYELADSSAANTGIRIAGHSGISGRGWVGRIGEVIVCNRELTLSEAANVRSYLRTRWGTP